MKASIQKLKGEAAFLNKEAKRLEKAGIHLKGTRYAHLDREPSFPLAPTKEKKVKVKLPGFHSQVIWPFVGDYSPLDETVDNLAWAIDHRRWIMRKVERLNWSARAVEMAFDLYGGHDLDPHWIKEPWHNDEMMKNIPGGEPGSTRRWDFRVIERTGDNPILLDMVGDKRPPITLCVRRFDKTVEVAESLLTGPPAPGR
jgi:hypothetical protein